MATKRSARVKTEKAPDRDLGITQEATIDGVRVVLTTSEYDDGRLASFRLRLDKQTNTLNGVLDSFCESVSIGLQHGIPLETFVEEYLFSRFAPAGDVLGNEVVRSCTSILDYTFRELAISYLDRDDLQQVVLSKEGLARRRARAKVDEARRISMTIVRRAADLAVLSAALVDQLTTLVDELRASLPNDAGALEQHLSYLRAVEAIGTMADELCSDLALLAQGEQSDGAMVTASKVQTIRDSVAELLAKNSDLVGTSVRMSIATGFIAFMSMAGADMLVATPTLLALFGGTKVVKIIRDLRRTDDK